MIRNILVAALVILAISIVLVLRFSSRLTMPLRDLTEAAKQADAGNYDFALDYDKDDEIGILTRTFKQLTAHTKDRLSDARKMATVDSLTGVKNKHAFTQWEEKIDADIAKGGQEPFALVVCDINNLKAINDMNGHKEGDSCIKNACARICGVFSHSPVFRIGGDEFVALLFGEDFLKRDELMAQINTIPEDLSKVRAGETIAAGMAEYDKDRHSSLTSVFEDADKAMYERKKRIKESLLPESQPTSAN